MNYTAIARGRHDTPCVRDALRATWTLDGGCLVACALHQRSAPRTHLAYCVERVHNTRRMRMRACAVLVVEVGCIGSARRRRAKPDSRTHDARVAMHSARCTMHSAPFCFGSGAEYTDTLERTAAALAWQQSVAPHRTGRLVACGESAGGCHCGETAAAIAYLGEHGGRGAAPRTPPAC